MTTTLDRLAGLERTHFWFEGRDDLVRNLLTRFGVTGPVLDVGCGTGSLARLLRAGGGAVVALDREVCSPPGDRVARVRGDAERLPCVTAGVGMVMVRDLLEHVDDALALAECRRVLGPGGLLIALVPAWPSLWSHRDERAGHLRRYTPGGLRAAVYGAGFDVLELRGYQFALLPLVMVSRLVARRRGAAQLEAEEHPPALVNNVLAAVNRAEARLARRSWSRPPTGSTLAVVARRR